MTPDTVPTDPGPQAEPPRAAGVYSFLLNPSKGKYTETDRDTAKQLVRQVPEIRDIVQNNRIFVRRAAKWLTTNGIDQIIDVGSGLPADKNTHEVAHKVNQDARVVYVDKDPVMAEVAGEMLRHTDNAVYLDRDMTQPETVLDDPLTRKLIDFDRPIGLMFALCLHLVPPDQCDTRELVRRYLDAVPSGSYLALSHPCADGVDPERQRAVLDVMSTGEQVTFLPESEIGAFFDGLELALPYEGAREAELTWSNRWGAKDPQKCDPSGVWILAGVARKP